MATTNNLRRYPRFESPKGTFSAWQSGGHRFVSRVENLCLGGMFLRTLEPPHLGTFIQLLLDTPVGEIRARAEVRNTRVKRGIGVKIVAMQQDDRARFAQWLKSLSSEDCRVPILLGNTFQQAGPDFRIREVGVPCKSCGSVNQSKFTGEIAIHFPGLKNIDKPVVWIFPELVVCVDCGTAEFVVPEAELRQLAKGDAASG